MVTELQEERAELAAVDAAEEAAEEEEAGTEDAAGAPAPPPPVALVQTVQLPEATRQRLKTIVQESVPLQKELAGLQSQINAILRTAMDFTGITGEVTNLNLDTGVVTVRPGEGEPVPAAASQRPVLLPNRAQRRKSGKGRDKSS